MGVENSALNRRGFLELCGKVLLVAGVYVYAPCLANPVTSIARVFCTEDELYQNVPVVVTGFESFRGRENNTSTDVVQMLQMESEGDANKIFITDLPVDENEPGAAADIIWSQIVNRFNYGVIIVIGEASSLTNEMRVEHQWRLPPSEAPRSDDSVFPLYQVNDELYLRLQKRSKQIVSDHQIIDPYFQFRAIFSFEKDTAGNYICEQTLTGLSQFIDTQEEGKKKNFLLLGIHVPHLEQNQMIEHIILDLVDAIADEGQRFVANNRCNVGGTI